MRNPNSGEPFSNSDDEIAAALQDVSIPTLLLSCVHMTDDESVRRSILEGPLKPAGLFLNEVQGYMSEDDKAAARTLALDIDDDRAVLMMEVALQKVLGRAAASSGPAPASLSLDDFKEVVAHFSAA